MLDCTFTETVTVRRPVSRGVKNETTFEEVLDEAGCPLPVRCRLEVRKRRTIDLNGTELDADAQMVYRVDKNTEIKTEYLVVTKDGKVYRVIGFEEAGIMFAGSAKYARLSLQFTRQEVPKDKPV